MADSPLCNTRNGLSSWDRLRQAQKRHSFCSPRDPVTPDSSTEVDLHRNFPFEETKHWVMVSQRLRVCHRFFQDAHTSRSSSTEDSDVHQPKKKRSRWDKVRRRRNLDDLESPPELQSERTLSSASTVLSVVTSSRKQAAQGALAVETEDPTACPAELDAPRWKKAWLCRKNNMEQGQGGPHRTRSTTVPFAQYPAGLICTRDGARHVMATCMGSVKPRPQGPAPHGRRFLPRTFSESNASLSLTSYYKYIRAKHPSWVRRAAFQQPKQGDFLSLSIDVFPEVNPKPCTLTTKPRSLQTLTSQPKPSIQTPKSQTLSPKPSTPNPQPSTLNPEHSSLSPQPGNRTSRPDRHARAARRQGAGEWLKRQANGSNTNGSNVWRAAHGEQPRMYRQARACQQPSEVAQTRAWTLFYLPLKRGEFASATRGMVTLQAVIRAPSSGS